MDFSLFAHNSTCSFCLCMDMNYATMRASFTFSCSVRQESSPYKKLAENALWFVPLHACTSVFFHFPFFSTDYIMEKSGRKKIGSDRVLGKMYVVQLHTALFKDRRKKVCEIIVSRKNHNRLFEHCSSRRIR